MAAAMVDRHQSPPTTWPMTWQMSTGHNGSSSSLNQQMQHFQPYQSMPSFASSGYDLPKHNEVEMTRDMLLDVLNYFSQLTAQQFGNRPIRLVVHGGACMLLHEGLYALSKQQQQMSPGMPGRTKTRDVDYIHRSFVKEMQGLGVMDAEARIKECVRGTARRFGLGLDWMNSDADIALPMAHDPSGNVYDPIYAASVQDNNIHLHTIFRSPNGLLTLISVTPFWAVALKLVRYSKWDPGDICLLLRNGQVLSHTNWSPESLESWLQTSCWAMGYAQYDGVKKGQMRSRIEHAIDQLAIWNQAVGIGNTRANGMGREGAVFGRTPSQHDAMGGGEVVGGGGETATSNGWWSSFGSTPAHEAKAIAPPAQAAFPAAVTMSVPPNFPPDAVNVRDWGCDDSPGSDSQRMKKDSDSGYHSSKGRSRSRSRGPGEIFIPPGADDDDDDGYYSYGMAAPEPQTRQWLNPNHAPVSQATARPVSRNPSPERYSHIYAPNPVPKPAPKSAMRPPAVANPYYGTPQLGGQRPTWALNAPYDYRASPAFGQQQQPYGLDSVNRSMAAALPYGYGHHRGVSQPVIPPASQLQKSQKSRKKKEKRKDKQRQQDRSSKWSFRRTPDSDSSDTDSDNEDSSAQEVQNRGRALYAGRPWHNRFASDAGQHLTVPSRPGSRNPSPSHDRDDQPGPSWLHASHPGSRNSSPHPNPNLRQPLKARPPPLNLTPPPMIPAALPPAQNQFQVHDEQRQTYGAPTRTNASELANYQFEEQRRAYELQRARQPEQQMREQQLARQMEEQIQQERSRVEPLARQQTAPEYYYHQQHQHQRYHQHSQRLRPSATEIYR